MQQNGGLKAEEHQRRQAGPKTDVKKQSSLYVQSQSARHTLVVQTKKHHLPVMDQTPLEPPPVVVVVVGPPKIGKCTLISSLVKTYSRQTLTDAKGPITVASGGDACDVHAGLLCSGKVGSVPCGVM